MSNRLAHESSPYLRQHAHNPVDWFAWGEEAIAKARSERKPLFVSVGYSTCYWCHVMERECFENEAIAAQLARDFVSVKVDREERPDVDEAMMSACQIYTAWTEGRASGGWPLTVFLDPDSLQPFFAGTYFPPVPAFGRLSFPDLLTQVATAWRDTPDAVRAQAQKIFLAMRASIDGDSPSDVDDPNSIEDPATTKSVATPLLRASSAQTRVSSIALPELATRVARGLLAYEDAQHGGFGGAPKFPQPAWLELMQQCAREIPECALVLTRALRALTLGGIHDHLGGGFHRYSVDALWRVPHFEKMLYDSAQLVPLLCASNDAWLERAATRALQWMTREMLRDDALFHTAQDAEVDGREGINFLWTAEEMDDALTPEDARFARHIFGLDAGANFTDPHHRDSPASNVLFLSEVPAKEMWEQLDRISEELCVVRATRKQPNTDTKALLGWNALAIRAFAQAGRLLRDDARADAYVAQATRSFDAAWSAFVEVASDDDGGQRVETVWRVRRGNLAPVGAALEDVACFAHAATALWDARGDARFHDAAWALLEYATRVHFDDAFRWCERAGIDQWGLRGRSVHDGAMPSGAGTMALVLARLARGTHAHGGEHCGENGGEHGAQARTLAARTLLTRTLRAAEEACLAEPTQAARTLVAAHAAKALVLPECLDGVLLTGTDSHRTLTVSFATGWHVVDTNTTNTVTTQSHACHAIELVGDGVSCVVTQSRSFVDDMPVYDGVVPITVRLAPHATRAVLRFQPCTHTHCLAHIEMPIDFTPLSS